MGSGASSTSQSRSITPVILQNLNKGVNDGAVNKNKQIEHSLSLEPKDVMISYSHADKEWMQKLRAGLEKNGITVWVDVIGLKAGVDFLAKIGQAIIDAKMFISLLSEKTIESKYCQDELALAYVSHKPIFPAALKPAGELFPLMDTGMKLQLARFKWHLFTEDSDFDATLLELVDEMKQQMAELAEKESEEIKKHVPEDNKTTKVSKSMYKRNKQLISSMADSSAQEEIDAMSAKEYWENNFKKLDKIEWKSFLEKFEENFSKGISMLFSNKKDKHFLEEILRRELNVEENEGFVKRNSYTKFCDEDESFWHKVQDQYIESYTMNEVFNMESSVRVEAIENLGKFRSKAVIDALKDLLSDPDNNVRAVAAISLAKTGSDDAEIVQRLMRCLSDSDRLVRESSILALGHLKADAAVGKIVHLWRNDFISSVREAAQVALEQIGGEEANKAMHMTKVLAEEIRTLTKD